MIKISIENNQIQADCESHDPDETIKPYIDIIIGLLRCVGFQDNTIKDYINTDQI